MLVAPGLPEKTRKKLEKKRETTEQKKNREKRNKTVSMKMFRILFRPNPQLRCFPTHLVMDELPGPTLQQLFRLVLLTQGHIARLDRGPFEQCSRWRLRQRKHRSKSTYCLSWGSKTRIAWSMTFLVNEVPFVPEPGSM